MSTTGLPLLFDASGPIATPPATLQQALLALAAASAPGYTAALPGSLIEDISSTDVGALVTLDQARVDAVNNVSPYTANPYILALQGAQYGIPKGAPANGNALVSFTGSAGYVIAPGFLVSDGTNQYAVQDGGVIPTGGTLSGVYVVATNPNLFAIPASSITQVVTSVPSPYTLTVTNPTAGNAAASAETVESYRARILEAYQSPLQGVVTVLKGALKSVPGVSSRLVAVLKNGTNFEVLCGGGDPYQVAGAIFASVSNPGMLVGSATTARNVTVSLYDAPDTYSIVFVNPPQQAVTLAITWNTTLANFTAAPAVNQFMIAAAQSYINGILVGQPINELVLIDTLQAAVASVLPAVNLTTLTFVVTINGVTATPTAGTFIIPSDTESYFNVSPTGVTCVQG